MDVVTEGGGGLEKETTIAPRRRLGFLYPSRQVMLELLFVTIFDGVYV